jgi:hypothetical protein
VIGCLVLVTGVVSVKLRKLGLAMVILQHQRKGYGVNIPTTMGSRGWQLPKSAPGFRLGDTSVADTPAESYIQNQYVQGIIPCPMMIG